MFRCKSLQRQLLVSLLLPVGLLLLVVGLLGFFYARKNLFQEWQEAAMLRLQRAAHHIDMRLSLPLSWMRTFSQVGIGQDRQVMQTWILGQLRELPGVAMVKLVWPDGHTEEYLTSGLSRPLSTRAHQVARLSPPRFLYEKGQEVVTLEAELQNLEGESLGQLQVAVEFHHLLADVLSMGWAQSYMACLVDSQGRYLAHTDPQMKKMSSLAESPDPLDKTILNEMLTKSWGTVMGPGDPPRKVIGFYRLATAPWVILLYARGDQILKPLLHFRFVYLASGFVCLVLILFFIRLGVSPVVSAIQTLSQRARQVALGMYGEPLSTKRQDEIGQLIQSFNTMIAGLQERDFIRNTFGRYVDPAIARKLLKRPQAQLLGGKKRPVAILFADLREFTPLAEGLSPEATIHLLNRFFSRMLQIIQSHEGITVDFVGDALLAFFDSLESSLAQAVQQAYYCALEMQTAMAEVNAEITTSGFPNLEMGIGIQAGEVVVGNIGSENRAKYGIVGAAVNLTHPLQAEARGGEVVMSAAAFEALPEKPPIVRTFTAHLKGVKEPLQLIVLGGNQGS